MSEPLSSSSAIDALISPRRVVRFNMNLSEVGIQRFSNALEASKRSSSVSRLDLSKAESKSGDGGRIRSQTALSPRQVQEQPAGDDVFKTINVAYQLLTTPLVHSNGRDDSSRYHRRSIKIHNKRIIDFRDTLHVAFNFNRHAALTASHIQRLDEICQKFLDEYRKVEHPQFPANFGAMTPRNRDTAQKAHTEALAKLQKMVRGVEVTKDALVQQCIADICALSQDYDERVNNAQSSLSKKVSALVSKPSG